MDLNAFWDLIERCRRCAADPEAHLAWLTEHLAGIPTAEIMDFQICLDEVHRRADTWHMWGAAYQICGGCSDDGFWYFQAWLVGLGRDAFERAVADPDTLADIPEVQRLAGRRLDDWAEDEWPDWESLDYLADEAYERATGEKDSLEGVLLARGHDNPLSPDPLDDRWDFDDPEQVARRLPRLSRMFP